MFIVALDPSLGTGGDPAAIQVFEARTTEQVAEWRHNRTDVPTQVRILADVVRELYAVTRDEKSIYYSVENNTLGEAAFISIAEFGDENIPGYLLTDNHVTAPQEERREQVRRKCRISHRVPHLIWRLSSPSSARPR
jgi:hypothetical protein